MGGWLADRGQWLRGGALQKVTIRLTRDMLELAYDLLCATPPFDKWNLPAGEDVQFKVTRSDDVRGDYYRDENGRHVIRISSRCNGTLASLIGTMAHEMIHLHESQNCTATRSQHNAAFRKFAEIVCRIHRFDAKAF